MRWKLCICCALVCLCRRERITLSRRLMYVAITGCLGGSVVSWYVWSSVNMEEKSKNEVVE